MKSAVTNPAPPKIHDDYTIQLNPQENAQGFK